MTIEMKLPAIDPETVSPRVGSAYPDIFAGPSAARLKRALGNAAGLNQFGVNLVDLPPGAWSAQRHWHENEDEFVYVVEGTVTLVSDDGTQELGPGMSAGFPAGKPDGHHLINATDEIVRYLEVGTRSPGEAVAYPDIDMQMKRSPGEPSKFLTRAGASFDDH